MNKGRTAERRACAVQQAEVLPEGTEKPLLSLDDMWVMDTYGQRLTVNGERIISEANRHNARAGQGTVVDRIDTLPLQPAASGALACAPCSCVDPMAS